MIVGLLKENKEFQNLLFVVVMILLIYIWTRNKSGNNKIITMKVVVEHLYQINITKF